jgi:hypothetical protein
LTADFAELCIRSGFSLTSRAIDSGLFGLEICKVNDFGGERRRLLLGQSGHGAELESAVAIETAITAIEPGAAPGGLALIAGSNSGI